MSPSIPHLRRVIGAFLACAASVAAAAPPTIHYVYDDPRRLVVPAIEASFAHFAEAASGYFLEAYRDRPIHQDQFDTFARRFLTGTFVEARYTWMDNGVQRVRTYHASSGDLELGPPIPGGRPALPYFTYFDPDAPEIVARWGPLEGSTVTHRPLEDGRGPDARRNDAELKAGQTLEHDIAEGIVPAGGHLVVYSSQEPCDSCGPALEALSDAHGIDIDVHVLSRRSHAYFRFDRQRRNYMASVLRIAWARRAAQRGDYEGAVGAGTAPPDPPTTLVPAGQRATDQCPGGGTPLQSFPP